MGAYLAFFKTQSKHTMLLSILGGLSLVELRQLYFNTKDTVFRQQSRIVSCICDTNALEKLLKDMFGTERRMDSIKKPK